MMTTRTLVIPFLLIPAASALACSDGQFSSDGLTCQTCTSNYFCQGGVLVQCPKYSISPPGSSSISQCVCPVNAAINNGVCMCIDGYLMGNAQCTPCPAGFYCPDQNTTKQCTNNALSLPGQSSPVNCNICPAGYVQNSPTASPISCRACALGSACPNITTEIACAAGTFAPPLGISCQTCPANTYSRQSSSACTACDPLATSPPASTSSASCTCADGYSMNFYGSCIICPAGLWCSRNQQTVCAAGTYSNAGQSSCWPCLPGTYQDGAGSSSCKTCPSGLQIQQTSTGTDMQAVINRFNVDTNSNGVLYIQGAQNYLIQAQGANITTWSFQATKAGCKVTPMLFSGSYSNANGPYTFSLISNGTTRTTTSAGPQTFPFSDDQKFFYTVPAVNQQIATSTYTFTYFGWYFTGQTCIPYDIPNQPSNPTVLPSTPVYVWSWTYVPSLTMYTWPAFSYPGVAMFWSVSVSSARTQTVYSSATGAGSIMQCLCPDGTRKLANGQCQNTCPDGKYIAYPTNTTCSPCAQGSACVNSIITPCATGFSSLPGASSCVPCVNPGQSTDIQLYTCKLLPACVPGLQGKCCSPNVPITVDRANGWTGLGTILAATGSVNGAIATPWLTRAPMLGLKLNPALDRPYALIQNSIDLTSTANNQVAVQFYYRCVGLTCPDWLVVDYSNDGGVTFPQILNITDFSDSAKAWVQISTSFFSNPEPIPTKIRIYAQMALGLCTVWIGQVEIVDLGYWTSSSTNGISLQKVDTFLLPRWSVVNKMQIPDLSKYQEPMETTNLALTDNAIAIALTPPVPGIYASYNYSASVYASGTGTLTLQLNSVDSKTWTVNSVSNPYTFFTTALPTMFSIKVTGTVVVKGPSLTLRTPVVGCQACLPNFYCPDPTTPIPCLAHSSSPAGSTKQTQCVCNPGYWGQPGVNGDSCKPCPVGASCPNGGPNYTVCANGTITIALAQTSCFTCNASDYCAFGSMRGCPPNSMSPPGEWDVAQCICNPGFYGIAPDCRVCEPGFFCINGTKTACTAHATSPPMSSNATACYCTPGYSGVRNSQCMNCSEGSYCYSGLINSCPNNMWSPQLSSVMANCSCDYGYYPVQASCSGCSSGSYKSSRGPGTCTSCATGKYSIGRAATSSSACISCPPGTYAVVEGQYQCQSCAAGTYSSGMGSSFCTQCWAGAYSTLGASVCTICSAGTYSAVVAATSLSTCQTCAAGSWAHSNSTACSFCGACSFWKYPPALHFFQGLVPGTQTTQLTSVLSNTQQQHYAFAISSIDGTMFMAMGTALYNVNLNTGALSVPLNLQGPSTRQWWYASIATSVLGNYLYVVQNPNVFRVDLAMGAYDTIYPSLMATCVAEDSTQPQTVLWIVQPTMLRKVDPIAAVDINSYTLSGATYVCVNPQDPVTLYVVGTFGLKSLNKNTGAFATLKTGIAFSVCQVTPDGNFIALTQVSPKIVVVYSLFDKTVTNVIGGATVSAIYIDGSNLVFGIDSVGVRNVSYSYADSRNCDPGQFNENTALTDPSQCILCSVGNLCPGGANITSCAPGTYSTQTGLREQAQCTVCPAGFFCQGATCPDTTGSGCSITAGVCSGGMCNANNSLQTCPRGSYSLSTGLMQAADCPLCVAGFYCPNPTTQLACPNNTWSVAGSQDLSACTCAPGYQCVITKIVHAQVMLAMTVAQFQAVQSKYIAAVAAAAGVSVNLVSVQGVFSTYSPPSGRRLLGHKGEWNSAAVDVHTLIHVSELRSLSNLNMHLRTQGLGPHRGVQVSLHQEIVQTYRNGGGW